MTRMRILMSPAKRRRALLEDAVLGVTAAALLWAGAMGFGRSLLAEDGPPADEKPKPVMSPAAERKLDQAIENDAAILDRFDAIMSEVAIVKVRALRTPETTP